MRCYSSSAMRLLRADNLMESFQNLGVFYRMDFDYYGTGEGGRIGLRRELVFRRLVSPAATEIRRRVFRAPLTRQAACSLAWSFNAWFADSLTKIDPPLQSAARCKCQNVLPSNAVAVLPRVVMVVLSLCTAFARTPRPTCTLTSTASGRC